MVALIKDKIIKLFFQFVSWFVFAIIATIFFVIISSGIKYFSIEFFTQFPSGGMTSGGIFPAILGSIILLVVTLIFAIPIGVLTGVFLSEFGNKTFIGRILDTSITSLSGVPSIVYGLFGYSLFSITLGFRTSIIAGSLTLAIMTLPIISSSVRESLRALPNTLRESAYALGAHKTQVIYKVLIPAARNRIITAILIGMGRVIGETAPVLLTAAVFYSTRLPGKILDPVMTLPSHIYFLAVSYGENAQWMAKGASAFLLLFILTIYTIAFMIRRKSNVK